MPDELIEDGPLTAEEVLTFGACVEAIAWTPVWLAESRAPIAVAAGRPKHGPIFNQDGVGNAVIIRPCMSRGRRLRGLAPVYTPQMLEGHAKVFDGWPMFMDHVAPEVAQALAKHGRSVRELGGQVLNGRWSKDFTHEDDGQYGYQKGAVLAEVWATPLIRRTVGENPNLLHTSIHAWPTSGKPGPVPWRPAVKGMVLEGIRRQPQGSVDFVVRGGAGGRLLIAEAEDDGAWPETGEWAREDRELVVSLAESLYASAQMADVVLPSDPSELQQWLQEHAPHLLPALAEASSTDDEDADDAKGKKRKKPTTDSGDSMGMSEAEVRRIIQESQAQQPTVEEFERRLQEQTERTIAEHAEQARLSGVAMTLIEAAQDIPPRWKADLRARYAIASAGVPATLVIAEADCLQESDGKTVTLTPQAVLEARVGGDLQHVRDLIAEARGKPRVTGEGGSRSDLSDSVVTGRNGRRDAPGALWQSRFADMGIAESEDKALEVFTSVEG